MKNEYTRREVIGTLGAALASSAVIFPTEVTAEEVAQVEVAKVARFRLAWNTKTGTGRVSLYTDKPMALQDNKPINRVDVPVPSILALPAYLAILKEDQVFYNARGWLYTGTEEIG